MLGVSFDQIGKRIAGRGNHNPPFPMNAPAADIAYSFRHAIYDESKEGELFFGMPLHQFTEAISSNNLEWVSDEEFDDSSYVLQFEDENQVRLVAFTGTPDFLYAPATLRDVSLSQNEFYWILQVWHDRFNDEWISLPKSFYFCPMTQFVRKPGAHLNLAPGKCLLIPPERFRLIPDSGISKKISSKSGKFSPLKIVHSNHHNPPSIHHKLTTN